MPAPTNLTISRPAYMFVTSILQCNKKTKYYILDNMYSKLNC